MKTGSTLIRVLPHYGGGWDVREPGHERALLQLDDRAEAIRRAQEMMVNGGAVQVLDEGGFLVETVIVASRGDRPRWYLQPSPLFWAMGGLFVLQGVFGLATLDLHQARFWLGLVAATVGMAYFVLLTLSLRHNRRLALAAD